MIARKKMRQVKESYDEIDSYALLTGLAQKVDELILSYKQYAEELPEWKEVFDTLSKQSLEQKGQIDALRNSISEEDTSAVLDGKVQAEKVLDARFAEPQESYYNEDAVVSMLDAGYATESLEDSNKYMILRKESEDKDEAFLEYHFEDQYQAQEEFFSSEAPAALLSLNEKGKWDIEALTEECSKPELKAILDEQIELLNN